MYKLAANIAQGPLQAAMLSAAFALLAFALLFAIPFLAALGVIFSAAAICLLLLAAGPSKALTALMISTVVTGLASYWLINAAGVAFVMLVGFWLPSFLFAYLLWRNRRIAMTLFSSCLLVIGIIVGLFVFGEPVQEWQRFYTEIVTPMMVESLGPQIVQSWEYQLLQDVRVLIMIVASQLWMLNVFALLLARYWQSLLVKPGAFAEEFMHMRFGSLIAWLALAAVLISVLLPQGKWADVAMISMSMLIVLFTFQGFALLKFWANRYQISNLALGLVYIVVSLPPLQIVLSLIGWSDNWIHFRRRFTAS